MTTPYKPISWNIGEQLTRDKLNQMANNEQWLFENSPRIMYNGHAIKRSQGLKIMAGKSTIRATKNKSSGWVQINFGTFFTAGCKPIIVASPATDNQITLLLTTRGINATSDPDHRGVQFQLYAVSDYARYQRIHRPTRINWIAVGF